MEVINATPHVVNVIGGIDIPPSGIVPRLETTEEKNGVVVVSGIEVPLFEQHFGGVVGLPEPKEGVLYITSLVVAQAAAAMGRNDIVAPHSVRDGSGKVVGCDGFILPKT
mgnify:CR=1 FL=1